MKLGLRVRVDRRLTRQMQPERYARALTDSINTVLGNLSEEFRESYKDFTHKPTETINKAVTGKYTGSVEYDGEVYYYVTKGTSERWAVMKGGYRPKTVVGRAASRPGGGETVIAGKRAMLARGMSARPGIEARNFDEMIVTKNEGKLGKETQGAITGVIRQS